MDRAAPQDELSNMSYMNSVSGLGSLSQGAGGPMRGSNAPLQGSGYGSLSGNLDFSSGVSLRNAIQFPMLIFLHQLNKAIDVCILLHVIPPFIL